VEERWNKTKTGGFLIALFTLVLNIVALALGTIIPIIPIALSIGCVGIITFIGVLTFANYLSHDPDLTKREMRKAIAASFALVYLVFLALVVFHSNFLYETKLAETVVGHFTWIVGIIIVFYFGSRTLEEYRKPKE